VAALTTTLWRTHLVTVQHLKELPKIGAGERSGVDSGDVPAHHSVRYAKVLGGDVPDDRAATWPPNAIESARFTPCHAARPMP
jgi:hypothetical protein